MDTHSYRGSPGLGRADGRPASWSQSDSWNQAQPAATVKESSVRTFPLTVENEGGDPGIHRLLAKSFVDNAIVTAYRLGCEQGTPGEERATIIAKVLESMGAEKPSA